MIDKLTAQKLADWLIDFSQRAAVQAIRAECAESELAKLREESRWHKYPEEKPDGVVMFLWNHEVFTGYPVSEGSNVWEVSAGIYQLFGDVSYWRPLPLPTEQPE